MTRSIQMSGKVAAVILGASLLLALAIPGGAGASASRSSAPATQSAILTCAQAKQAVKTAKKAVGKAHTVRQYKKAQKRLAKAKQKKKVLCGGTAGGGGAAGAWSDGRWDGTYAENNIDLRFNVVGNRLYTGPFDDFFVTATCGGVNGGTDSSAVSPVQATIAANGDFSGSGVFNNGFTQIPWTISGHISGTAITGGIFSVSYTNTFGDPCSGTTHFTAQWFGAYTL